MNNDTNFSGWWLSHPSEKYESQLGWWHSQYDGKNKIHVPNHQPGIAHLESQGGCTVQVEMSASQTIGGSLSTGMIIQPQKICHVGKSRCTNQVFFGKATQKKRDSLCIDRILSQL